MHTGSFIPLLLTCITVLALAVPAASFGAGAIPNYAYLNDKAFRHGDIEEVLVNLVKDVGGGGSGLLGIAAALFASLSGGTRFSKMDIRRVYFGNWLRDYSQAMDIAGLSKLTAQTLITLVSILGFMTFGFATAEFEITPERLGVYLPVEHIDNPKGYAVQEGGDARHVHPHLRPPVDPRELEINPHNGMKNYIATEGEAWDTSTAHVRRTLRECISLGRKARGTENADQFEAFRLLGTALHTLEDLLAHSNWCELALRRLGHADVFCHVGDAVVIETPSGSAPPLVTGTFGSADFMHSVLGEGMDRLSEASVTNLAGKIDEAKSKLEPSGHISTIRTLLSKFGVGDEAHAEKLAQAENIKEKALSFTVGDVAPEEVQHMLWHALEWRDTVYRDILATIARVPGLTELFEELAEALNAFVFAILDPVLKPLLQEATDALQDGSKAVIDTDDQYEVFNDPHASDPSHSMLAKDHFGLILNEPAGKVAQVVVEHTVNLVVKAWCDERENVDRAIDKVLEAFHHPYYATSKSEIQRLMIDRLSQWLGGLGVEEKEKTLQALTKESVREGGHKRLAAPEDTETEGNAAAAADSAARVAVDSQPELTHEAEVPSDPIRGIRYDPQPGRPLYARFDGQHEQRRQREQRAKLDEERRRVEKSDEDFWRDPYAREERRPLSHYADTAQRPRPQPASYVGQRAYSGRTTAITPPEHFEDHVFAPARILEDAEAGYRAAFGPTQTGTREPYAEDSERNGRRQRRAGVRGTPYEGAKYPYADRSAAFDEPPPFVEETSYNYYTTGGGGGAQREGGQATGSVFRRYDSYRARGGGEEAPPAFFLRSYSNPGPEGALYGAPDPDATYDGGGRGFGKRPSHGGDEKKKDELDEEETFGGEKLAEKQGGYGYGSTSKERDYF